MPSFRGERDLLTGIILIATAIAFGAQAIQLKIGTLADMGPGYFPLLVAVILGLLGIVISANSLRIVAPLPGKLAWRGLFFTTLAVTAFAAAARPLGFLPTLTLTVFLSTLASSGFRWRRAALITCGVTTLCWLIFIVGIELSFPALGPMLTW
jgi:putative tricarboxylic transport membrane protein